MQINKWRHITFVSFIKERLNGHFVLMWLRRYKNEMELDLDEFKSSWDVESLCFKMSTFEFLQTSLSFCIRLRKPARQFLFLKGVMSTGFSRFCYRPEVNALKFKLNTFCRTRSAPRISRERNQMIFFKTCFKWRRNRTQFLAISPKSKGQTWKHPPFSSEPSAAQNTLLWFQRTFSVIFDETEPVLLGLSPLQYVNI